MTCTCSLNTVVCGCGRLVLSSVVEAAVEARKGVVCTVCGARCPAPTLAGRVWAAHIRQCERPARHQIQVIVR